MPRKKRSLSPFELMDDDFDDTSSQSSRNGNPPIQRNAANARERARMRVLSSAFGRLKTKLPNIPADTKLSKLDTLRLATMYIKQLKSVVEGEAAAAATTNGENMERSANNNSTNCYLNLNVGVQSMNWPFGFHHHFSNSPLTRSTSSASLLNNNSNNNNWCSGDSSNEEQIKQVFYETENYKHHHHHHSQQQQQQSSSTLMNHNNLSQQSNNRQQHDNWYSETSSPELDSTASGMCMNFENSHFQHQPDYQRQQQLQNISRHHNHNMSHLQPASLHSTATFQLQHDFQRITQHQQHQPSATHHLHQNGFVNSSNFQSTSIR